MPAYPEIKPPGWTAISRRVVCVAAALFVAADLWAATELQSNDTLGHALRAEFALQAGRTEESARAYAQAASFGARPDLFERAAIVTLYAKDFEAAIRVGQRWQQLDPEAVGARRTLAWAALATGDAQRGDALLAELLAMCDLEAQRAAAQVLVAAETRSLAPAALRRLAAADALVTLDQGPNWPALASNLGEHAVAMRLAQAESRARPKDPEVWRRNAQVLLAANDREAAIDALEKAVALSPQDFDLRLALAGLHSEAGALARAERVLAQGDPQDERLLSARLANLANDPDRKLLKRVERDLRRSKAELVPSRAFLLGQLHELREEPDLALSWYAQQPPGTAWAEAQLRRGVLLARDKQDLPAARALLGELRRRVDDDQQRVDAWLLEAELLAPTDRQAAAQVYDEALAQNGSEVRLLYARALFRIAADDVAGLERDLRSILELDPENAQALNALGYTLADRTDRHQEALGYIQRAIARQPDDGAVVDSMGWVQYRLGNLDEALRHLRRAYGLVQDGEVGAHLAEVLWASGHNDEARALWRDLLRRFADNPALRESVQRLQPDLLP
ncbi:MAG: tetratricopeptide repeat protein [Xanthomonadales bacterium]|nr:hypothetical protein [Xanthomonadales bacterium]MCC6593971.1 tetratricopeptide repeat protein [Xanthomonadales bacterium]